MLYHEFTRPVSVLPDEMAFSSIVLIHRRICIEHLDSECCPCCPRRYTLEQTERADFLDQLNADLDGELQ